MLVGLLADQIVLNRHLIITNMRTEPLCQACGGQEETCYHVLGRFLANLLERTSVFATHLMQPEQLYTDWAWFTAIHRITHTKVEHASRKSNTCMFHFFLCPPCTMLTFFTVFTFETIKNGLQQQMP